MENEIPLTSLKYMHVLKDAGVYTDGKWFSDPADQKIQFKQKNKPIAEIWLLS